MVNRKQVYNLLKGFSVVVLYTAFFAVQLFFNFDLSSQKNNSASYAVQHISTQHHTAPVFEYQKSVSAKTNIRLNKRFQPSSIPDCLFPEFAVNVTYNEPAFSNLYKEALSNSVSLSSYLRGPPVAA